MKITSIETLRTEEFANVIWVRIHTDAGVIGLGETFYGAGAIEAQIHDTFAGRLLGRNPLHIEAIDRDMLNLPMAQSSTGVEYRAASAIDIALWDLFGKVCGQPVHQMLGGLCRDRQRIYNTCAGGSNGQIFMAEMPLSRRLSASASARFMKASRSS